MKRPILIDCQDYQRFPTLLVNEREADPFPWEEHFTSKSERGPLLLGSVSLPGLTNQIAILRLTFEQLLLALHRDTDPLPEMLRRAAGIPVFNIIVEGTFDDLDRAPRIPNKERPWDLVVKYQHRYARPILFASSCHSAAHLCESILKNWLTEQQRQLNKFCTAMDRIERKKAPATTEEEPKP